MKPVMVVFAVCCIFLLCDIGNAHPPSDVTLAYDTGTATLDASIVHSVKKITRHFVERIVVELNGDEIIEQKFGIQGNEETQDVSYIIPGVQIGDTVKITAYCNISGKKTETLSVSESGDE